MRPKFLYVKSFWEPNYHIVIGWWLSLGWWPSYHNTLIIIYLWINPKNRPHYIFSLKSLCGWVVVGISWWLCVIETQTFLVSVSNLSLRLRNVQSQSPSRWSISKDSIYIIVYYSNTFEVQLYNINYSSLGGKKPPWIRPGIYILSKPHELFVPSLIYIILISTTPWIMNNNTWFYYCNKKI